MRPRSWVVSASAEDRCAAILICLSSSRFLLKWQRSRTCPLNPTKISGVCGRLMCLPENEEETYEVLNSKLPGIGDTVTTADGLRGEVH